MSSASWERYREGRWRWHQEEGKGSYRVDSIKTIASSTWMYIYDCREPSMDECHSMVRSGWIISTHTHRGQGATQLNVPRCGVTSVVPTSVNQPHSGDPRTPLPLTCSAITCLTKEVQEGAETLYRATFPRGTQNYTESTSLKCVNDYSARNKKNDLNFFFVDESLSWFSKWNESVQSLYWAYNQAGVAAAAATTEAAAAATASGEAVTGQKSNKALWTNPRRRMRVQRTRFVAGRGGSSALVVKSHLQITPWNDRLTPTGGTHQERMEGNT